MLVKEILDVTLAAPFSLFTWYLAPAHADSASCLCTQVTGPNEDVLKDNYSVHGYVWHR